MKTFIVKYRWEGETYRTLFDARNINAAKINFGAKFPHVEIVDCYEATI